jgi:hypothetical protein
MKHTGKVSYKQKIHERYATLKGSNSTGSIEIMISLIYIYIKFNWRKNGLKVPDFR